MKNSRLLLAAVPAVLMVAAGCGGGDKKHDVVGTTGYVQIERLARPAVNEGLITTNAYLNAFNSIPPTLDLTSAAQPVVLEAVGTLNAVDMLDGVDNVDPLAIAGAFLPDVMRIDTTIAAAPPVIGYVSGASATKGILLGGRKIEDDVIDITLKVLVGNTSAAISDHVDYAGHPGNPAQPGHQKLHGQSSYGGTATFPFLAKPN